jgi:hypothetical protein
MFSDDFFYYGDDDDDDLSGADADDTFGGDGGDDGEPPWFGNEVTLYDYDREPHSHTLDEWLDLALQPDEFLYEYYDMDKMHIMYQLDDQQLLTAQDWAEWRAWYNALYPERAFFHYSRSYGR